MAVILPNNFLDDLRAGFQELIETRCTEQHLGNPELYRNAARLWINNLLIALSNGARRLHRAREAHKQLLQAMISRYSTDATACHSMTSLLVTIVDLLKNSENAQPGIWDGHRCRLEEVLQWRPDTGLDSWEHSAACLGQLATAIEMSRISRGMASL